MRQIAATHRGDKSHRLHCCCDKSLRQDTCFEHASEFGRGEMWTSFQIQHGGPANTAMIAFWSNVKLMYADYAIVSLFLIRFLARSIALAWQPKGWIISSGLNFSHSLYDFYPIGLYFPYKTRLPFYLLLHSILKWKKLRIAQVVYLGPHVRSPFWMFFFWGITGN